MINLPHTAMLDYRGTVKARSTWIVLLFHT